jgi:hypothetical protein
VKDVGPSIVDSRVRACVCFYLLPTAYDVTYAVMVKDGNRRNLLHFEGDGYVKDVGSHYC